MNGEQPEFYLYSMPLATHMLQGAVLLSFKQ